MTPVLKSPERVVRPVKDDRSSDQVPVETCESLPVAWDDIAEIDRPMTFSDPLVDAE